VKPAEKGRQPLLVILAEGIPCIARKRGRFVERAVGRVEVEKRPLICKLLTERKIALQNRRFLQDA